MSRSVKTSVSVNKSRTSKNKKAPTEWRERISAENYELLRDTFLVFDEDGSGEIDPAEISKVLEELGLNQRNHNVINIIQALR